MKVKINSNQNSSSVSPAGASVQNALVPITVAGVVVPSKELGTNGWQRRFRLICANGVQYAIEASPEWRNVLSRYEWEEVKVVGLLNKAIMAIILQKLFPVGPDGSGLSMAKFAVKGVCRLAKDVFRKPEGLVAAKLALG
jgi:hypothetical protein